MAEMSDYWLYSMNRLRKILLDFLHIRHVVQGVFEDASELRKQFIKISNLVIFFTLISAPEMAQQDSKTCSEAMRNDAPSVHGGKSLATHVQRVNVWQKRGHRMEKASRKRLYWITLIVLKHRRRTLKSTLHSTMFWEMVKFVDLGVLYFSLELLRQSRWTAGGPE